LCLPDAKLSTNYTQKNVNNNCEPKKKTGSTSQQRRVKVTRTVPNQAVLPAPSGEMVELELPLPATNTFLMYALYRQFSSDTKQH